MTMLERIVYAKKLVLPAKKANSLQTVQMAAAFTALAGQENLQLFFYPGFRVERHDPELAHYLAGLGIAPESAKNWRPLRAEMRGLYGLLFRLSVLMRLCSTKNTLFYARDLSEASLIAKFRGAPFFRGHGLFLFEMHEVLFKHRQAAGKRHWQDTRLREQSIMDAADGLVVVHQVLAEKARELFNYRKPILVEPNCYNERVFKPVDLFSPERPWPAPNSDSRVELVYMGSVRRNKGIDELLETMRLLPERFHLTIIGRGHPDYLVELEELRRKIPNAEQRVRFTGFVPQADLFALCGGAHISVIPQPSVGGFFCPLKLNESLALGLPVVATPLKIFDNVTNLTHAARDCSPEGLAGAITELAENPVLAEKLRQRGLAAVEQYTWNKRVSRVFEFAQNLQNGSA